MEGEMSGANGPNSKNSSRSNDDEETEDVRNEESKDDLKEELAEEQRKEEEKVADDKTKVLDVLLPKLELSGSDGEQAKDVDLEKAENELTNEEEAEDFCKEIEEYLQKAEKEPKIEIFQNELTNRGETQALRKEMEKLAKDEEAKHGNNEEQGVQNEPKIETTQNDLTNKEEALDLRKEIEKFSKDEDSKHGNNEEEGVQGGLQKPQDELTNKEEALDLRKEIEKFAKDEDPKHSTNEAEGVQDGLQKAQDKPKIETTKNDLTNKEGEIVQESNARFVRRSDGTKTFHVGKEVFDVFKTEMPGNSNQVFSKQGNLLREEGVFRKKITLRPHSTDSATLKKMTLSVLDPEKYKTAKMEPRTRSRRPPQPPKVHAELPQTKGAKQGHSYQQNDGSDDENAISINAIKERYRKKRPLPTQNSQGNEKRRCPATVGWGPGAFKRTDCADGGNDDDFIGRPKKKVDRAKLAKSLLSSDSD